MLLLAKPRVKQNSRGACCPPTGPPARTGKYLQFNEAGQFFHSHVESSLRLSVLRKNVLFRGGRYVHRPTINQSINQSLACKGGNRTMGNGLTTKARGDNQWYPLQESKYYVQITQERVSGRKQFCGTRSRHVITHLCLFNICPSCHSGNKVLSNTAVVSRRQPGWFLRA